MLDGETEAGESCFGCLSKGERCRDAAGECLYLLRSSETVKFYAVSLPNAALPIIREKVKPDSVVYADCHSHDVPDISELKQLASITVLIL